MKHSELIGVETLRKYFEYNPDTGVIRWRVSKQGISAGTEFGSEKPCSKTTYRVGKLFNRRMFSHRLAWVLYYGEWPNDVIDHINHNGLDNRISNLRVTNRSHNNRNAALRKDSTSGVAGVSWNRSLSKWVAQINADGKRKHLGVFACMEDAIEARKSAVLQYGYHQNHGAKVSE